MQPATIGRDDPASSTARLAMVDNQIRTYDVTDQKVLAAFSVVPREMFVAPGQADLAYSDAVLTVAGATTRRVMQTPMVLARLFQGLALNPSDRVLVLAAGTGYAAAVAAELCGTVVAVETDKAFVDAAAANARALGLTQVVSVEGALTEGHAARAPYSAILVCGAVERNLDTLFGQLDQGGRLVTIQTASHEATRRSGKAVRYDRNAPEPSSRVLFDAIVPVLEAFRVEPSFVF